MSQLNNYHLTLALEGCCQFHQLSHFCGILFEVSMITTVVAVSTLVCSFTWLNLMNTAACTWSCLHQCQLVPTGHGVQLCAFQLMCEQVSSSVTYSQGTTEFRLFYAAQYLSETRAWTFFPGRGYGKFICDRPGGLSPCFLWESPTHRRRDQYHQRKQSFTVMEGGGVSWSGLGLSPL